MKGKAIASHGTESWEQQKTKPVDNKEPEKHNSNS
jgi:hypothetical protein